MSAETLTLRDPDGVLLKSEDGRYLRFIRARCSALVERLLQDEMLVKKASLIPSLIVDPKEAEIFLQKYGHQLPWHPDELGFVLEHEAVFFPSYPYEWCSEALERAGQLTLDIAEESIKRGWGLKDATPYNILYEGTKPVFVDWLSLENRAPSDPTWIAFSQFIRCFVLPLWMEKNSSLPLPAIFLSERDGITPERAYELVRTWRRFTPSFFILVTLPVWLNRKHSQRKSQSALYAKSDIPAKRAKFILKKLFGFLREQLNRVATNKKKWSPWNGYLGSKSPYAPAQWELKRKTLESWLEKANPKAVLDIGCAEGWFSFLAAKAGAKVIAIDSDREMVRRTWVSADKQKLDVQALHINLCRPTPATGWNNQENASFLDRCESKFDVVAVLAVLHHLSIGEQISYAEFFSVLKRMTKSHLFIEFVGPEDESFPWAAKGRNADAWDKASFLKTVQSEFHIVDEKPIPHSDRTLFWLQKREA